MFVILDMAQERQVLESDGRSRQQTGVDGEGPQASTSSSKWAPLYHTPKKQTPLNPTYNNNEKRTQQERGPLPSTSTNVSTLSFNSTKGKRPLSSTSAVYTEISEDNVHSYVNDARKVNFTCLSINKN